MALTVVGFLVSGFAGAGAYFLPALRTAVAATGHTVHASTVNVATPAPVAGGPMNVLLLGSDDDAKFQQGHVLTQSMIIVHVVPATKQVTMFSIPRDLYAPLSTGGTDKIDKAYLDGGANAAIQTVENDFHVQIDHYVWIGLQGLVTLIDTIGGIDLVAGNPVVDDYYPADLNSADPYAYERVAVLPGAQHMNGSEALQYVRSRHDDIREDFGRATRQQEVLVAIRDRLKSMSIADIPALAGALSGAITTDMSLGEASSLLPLAGEITGPNIQHVELLPPYTSGQTIGGQDVLVPDWSRILTLAGQIFG